jgi:hypothetical protein
MLMYQTDGSRAAAWREEGKTSIIVKNEAEVARKYLKD